VAGTFNEVTSIDDARLWLHAAGEGSWKKPDEPALGSGKGSTNTARRGVLVANSGAVSTTPYAGDP